MEVADMEDITSFVKNTKERLDLKNDYVFKRIFSKPENNEELKELLEAILNIEIEKVEVKNPEITKNYADEKLGVLDIRAQINEDTMIDIEMQVANVKTMVNRNIIYTCRLIAEDTRVGEEYRGLKKFISITILGENLLKRNSYHSIVHLKFENSEPEKQQPAVKIRSWHISSISSFRPSVRFLGFPRLLFLPVYFLP